MKNEKDITVVFLMWMPYGFECFKNFINSYIQHPAGVEHGLVIVFKDDDHSESAIKIYIDLLNIIIKN